MKEGKTIVAPSAPEGNSKQQADQRLKEELMQLESAEADSEENEEEVVAQANDPVDGESDETAVAAAEESNPEADV